MDWMMELPHELQVALIGFAVAVIGAFGSWFVSTIYSINELRKIKIEQEQLRIDAQKSETERDNKRDEIFNTFVVDWNKRLEEQQKKLDDYGERVILLREANAKLEGQIEAITDNHNKERESWKVQRQELLDRISGLERRIAELEHERRSNHELIDQLKLERDSLRKQLKEHDKLILDLTGDKSQLELALLNCQKEKQEEKKKTSELKDKITKFEQPPDKTKDTEKKKEDIA